MLFSFSKESGLVTTSLIPTFSHFLSVLWLENAVTAMIVVLIGEPKTFLCKYELLYWSRL